VKIVEKGVQVILEGNKLKDTIKSIILMFIAIPGVLNASSIESGSYHNFGIEGYYYQYRETVDNSFLMKDTGPVFGAYYDFVYRPTDTHFKFALETRAAYAPNTHYHSADTGDSKHDRYWVVEARPLGAYAINLENQWITEGYSGIGLRYLTNPANKRLTTTGHSSYLRKSRYSYVPIGVRIIKELQNKIQWVGYLEYDWFLSGLQRSYITDPFTAHNHQSHGYGARVGIDLHIPASEFNYTIGVFVRYWHIKDSELDDRFGGFEPDNTTQEVGIRLGLVF